MAPNSSASSANAVKNPVLELHRSQIRAKLRPFSANPNFDLLEKCVCKLIGCLDATDSLHPPKRAKYMGLIQNINIFVSGLSPNKPTSNQEDRARQYAMDADANVYEIEQPDSTLLAGKGGTGGAGQTGGPGGQGGGFEFSDRYANKIVDGRTAHLHKPGFGGTGGEGTVGGPGGVGGGFKINDSK